MTNLSERTVRLGDIVRILNEAVALDPVAMYFLRCQRVQANQNLADHPTIIVGVPQPIEEQGIYMLTFLGLLNGVAAEVGAAVAEMYTDDIEKPMFCGYTLIDESEVGNA